MSKSKIDKSVFYLKDIEFLKKLVYELHEETNMPVEEIAKQINEDAMRTATYFDIYRNFFKVLMNEILENENISVLAAVPLNIVSYTYEFTFDLLMNILDNKKEVMKNMNGVLDALKDILNKKLKEVD